MNENHRKSQAYMANMNTIVHVLTTKYFHKGYLNQSQCRLVYHSMYHKLRSTSKNYNDFEIKMYVYKCMVEIMAKK